MPTEHLALQHIIHGRLFGCLGASTRLDKHLHPIECGFINHRLCKAGNDFAIITVLADIGCVGEDAAESIITQFPAARPAHTSRAQFIDDFLHAHALGILFKDIAHNPCGLFVNDQFPIDGLIAIRHGPAAEFTLCNVFPLAAKNLLPEIEGIILC